MNFAPSSASPAANSARSSACHSHDGGAAGVVGLAGAERADQRALLALRAQVRVDQQRRVGRRKLQQPAQLGADRLRGLGSAPFACRVVDRERVVHEDDVGVAAEARTRDRRSGPSRSPRTWSAAGRAAPPRSCAIVAASTASSDAVVIAVSASPVSARSIRPSTFAAATRNSSRRRSERTATATAPRRRRCRRAAAIISARSAATGLRHQLGVVGEQRDGLRGTQQQAGRVPARGEHAWPSARRPWSRRAAAAGTRESRRVPR